MKNFAPGTGARHGHEFRRPVQAHGIMSQCTKMAEIPTWSTTQIKDGVRRIALNRVQEPCAVLADIVIPWAIPERVTAADTGKLWARLDEKLAGKLYVAGRHFTMGDIGGLL